MESATTMPILIMGERDEEPCWSCCSVDASGAGAAAAAVEAGGGLLSDKQRRAQGKSEADGIAQHDHQQRWLAQCQSIKVDSVEISWWSSCCDPAGGEKIIKFCFRHTVCPANGVIFGYLYGHAILIC